MSGVGASAASKPVEVVVVDEAVGPDIARLSSRAGAWGVARQEAVDSGRVEVRPPAPSDTDLSLLPRVAPPKPLEIAADEAVDPPVDTETPELDPAVEPEPESPVEPEPQPVTPAPPPEVEEVDDGGDQAPAGPTAPSQVDGRVPPPAGGPTAGQWDALRRCESTHNYGAINHTGTYRGAYQFSQQTWDWVAGIHWSHLVGIDPAVAQPAWQDIMAYTLYAMRGWDQWPICGQNLL